jgi:hypothetical protein
VTLRRRLALAFAAGIVTAAYVLYFDVSTNQLGLGGSDFDQLWFAARAVWSGTNPYEVIGPGRQFNWAWPLLYPLPAVMAVLPISSLPLLAARLVFAAASVGILAFALLRRNAGMLAILGSAAVLDAARAGQLSLLLTAAVILSWLAFVLALKPPVGIALLIASPKRVSLIAALLGGSLLTIAAFVAQPHWMASWFAALRTTTHMRAPVLGFGGPLLLLALFRWRRLDARVLLACACVPHTPSLYDVVPICLVARDFRESLMFALLTHAALISQDILVPGLEPAAAATMAARILNITIYLPALLAILTRPNSIDRDSADRLDAVGTIDLETPQSHSSSTSRRDNTRSSRFTRFVKSLLHRSGRRLQAGHM